MWPWHLIQLLSNCNYKNHNTNKILRLKCTKLDFCWSSAPDPAGEAYSAPPGSLAVFKGPTSKGRERKGKVREWMGVEGWPPIGESGCADKLLVHC